MYLRALRDGKENDCFLRVNIVGNYGQGKTTLLGNLLKQKIVNNKGTNGIQVKHYKCMRSKSGKFEFETIGTIKRHAYIKRLKSASLKDKDIKQTQQMNSTTIAKTSISSESKTLSNKTTPKALFGAEVQPTTDKIPYLRQPKENICKDLMQNQTVSRKLNGAEKKQNKSTDDAL
jgi:septin family protein